VEAQRRQWPMEGSYSAIFGSTQGHDKAIGACDGEFILAETAGELFPIRLKCM
jgi:hypothetical protein